LQDGSLERPFRDPEKAKERDIMRNWGGRENKDEPKIF
jgi:hypothetical protein